FKRDDTTLLTKNTNKSRSANSPLFNQPLQGKVIGIIHKSQLHLNK
ncbi:MAG: dihydroorotase, partial [Pedobacter sp.]|nr:dihydroorotase [Chitinophagaceae bacterium]